MTAAAKKSLQANAAAEEKNRRTTATPQHTAACQTSAEVPLSFNSMDKEKASKKRWKSKLEAEIKLEIFFMCRNKKMDEKNENS